MALFAGDKHFCKVFWMEPGDTVIRRVYKITVQQPTGLVDHYEGDELPDAMVIQIGPSSRRQNASMQVLMRPEFRLGDWEPEVRIPQWNRESRMAERTSVRFPIEYHWPRRRDIIHMGAGFFLLGLIRLFLIVAELSQ